MIFKNDAVKRDNLHFGELVQVCKTRYDEDDILRVYEYRPVRSILFTKEYLKGRDVLSRTHTYPVVGYSSDDALKEGALVINDYYRLAYILTLLGYREWLTKNNLREIKKEIFMSNFVAENQEIFKIRDSLLDPDLQAKREEDKIEDIDYLYHLKRLSKQLKGEAGPWYRSDPFKPVLAESMIKYGLKKI